MTHYLPSADRRPRAPLGGGKHENAAGVVRALMTRCEKPPRAAAAGRENGEVNPTVAGAVVILTATLISLAPAALPAEEKNLVAARNGAQVIKYTSQLGGEWRVEKLIDEQITPAGWASADGSLPQEIIFRLPALLRFNTLVFNPRSEAPDSQWARDLSVYTADPFPTMGGWKLVARVQLTREPTDQVFTVAPVDGRFIRMVITSAQSPDAPRVSLNEFKVFMR